jgi:hypothetical protein
MQLYLNVEEYEILKTVFYTHDWLCDCQEFPECRDFKAYQKLGEKIKNLQDKEYANLNKRTASYNALVLEMRQEKINRGEDPGPLVYV